MSSILQLLDTVRLFVPIVSAVSTLFLALVAYAFLRTTLKQRSESHYDDVKKRAELSEMRLSYEREIAALNQKLTATEQRWKDTNHLLLSSQTAQADRISTPVPVRSEFLKSMGIDQSDLKIDQRLVFVLMPFDDEFLPIYETIVRVCSRLNLVCLRGDEQRALGDILTHVVRQLAKSRVVIAEVGTRNPNVFYELGLAHAFDKQTILIAKSIEGVPFNLRSARVLLYASKDMLERELTTTLARVFVSPQLGELP